MRYKLFKYYSNIFKNCCNVLTCDDTKTKSDYYFIYFKICDSHNIYRNYSEDFYLVFSFTCSITFFYGLLNKLPAVSVQSLNSLKVLCYRKIPNTRRTV